MGSSCVLPILRLPLCSSQGQRSDEVACGEFVTFPSCSKGCCQCDPNTCSVASSLLCRLQARGVAPLSRMGRWILLPMASLLGPPPLDRPTTSLRGYVARFARAMHRQQAEFVAKLVAGIVLFTLTHLILMTALLLSRTKKSTRVRSSVWADSSCWLEASASDSVRKLPSST